MSKKSRIITFIIGAIIVILSAAVWESVFEGDTNTKTPASPTLAPSDSDGIDYTL